MTIIGEEKISLELSLLSVSFSNFWDSCRVKISFAPVMKLV